MDSEWLNTLPMHDPFAAQDKVLQWLKDFVAEAGTLDRRQLDALMQVAQHCAANIATLSGRYVNTHTLTYDDEDRLWETVYGFYHYLSRAYMAFLSVHQDHPEQSLLHTELPLIAVHALHTLSRTAKWHYFRYQPIPAGEWLRMHKLYELAEQGGFTGQRIKLVDSDSETTCTAAYLRALMLDTVSRTDMSKKEVELVDGWLDDWMQSVPLEQEFEEEWQLFYVDISADRGGRRIRNLEPTPNCRYWDTDTLVRTIERARAGLQLGEIPAWININNDINGMDYPRLLHHLLSEWSRDAYQRQRRVEERADVRKKAEAIHGIFSVCQHVKNVMFARHGEANTLGAQPSEFDDADERWVIENESPNGFGATVDPEVDTWLKVGRLVALNYEKNKDMTVIGVVRNLNQMANGRCYVGIQALSHTPTYVLMRGLSQDTQASTEMAFTSTLAFEGMSPFPGIYLPRIDAKNTPSTLVIPAHEFVDAGMFEMRMENHPYLVRLGAMLEQNDDWVRVEVKEVKTASKKN